MKAIQSDVIDILVQWKMLRLVIYQFWFFKTSIMELRLKLEVKTNILKFLDSRISLVAETSLTLMQILPYYISHFQWAKSLHLACVVVQKAGFDHVKQFILAEGRVSLRARHTPPVVCRELINNREVLELQENVATKRGYVFVGHELEKLVKYTTSI